MKQPDADVLRRSRYICHTGRQPALCVQPHVRPQGGASAAERCRSVGPALDLVRHDLLISTEGSARPSARSSRSTSTPSATEEGLASGLEVPVTCAPGSAPTLSGGIHDNDAFPAVGAQLDLAVSALACGLTRSVHRVVAHRRAGGVQLARPERGPPQPQPHRQLQPHRYRPLRPRRALVCGAVRTPAAAPRRPARPRGGSLWTPPWWCGPGLGDGREHICQDVPFIAGRQVGSITAASSTWADATAHLLVSLCHTLGLGNSTFGNPAAGVGPLEELA